MLNTCFETAENFLDGSYPLMVVVDEHE